MNHALNGRFEMVQRLLQDPQVRATINTQNNYGRTALHYVCNSGVSEEKRVALAILLLQCGADYTQTDADGETPLTLLQRSFYNPPHASIAVLEQAPDAEKASLLVKARRLVIAASSNTALPTCLQGRVARGQPLPRVALVPTAGDQDEGEVEASKLRSMVGFLLGIEDMLESKSLPARVFRVVADLLMPSWDIVLQDAGEMKEGTQEGKAAAREGKRACGQGMCTRMRLRSTSNYKKKG